MVDEAMVRPELIRLDSASRERVLRQIAAKGGRCGRCGATNFEVGDALYLGFLFLDEDQDAYMVALTCRNPDCSLPRTGIVLRDREFVTPAEDAAAVGERRRPGGAE